MNTRLERPLCAFALALSLGGLLPARGGAAVVLNEIVASNIIGAEDENGDHEDWIELYNSGAGSVDLFGYGLSDDVDDPLKWRFPSHSLAPGGHLLVFASGEDDITGELHCNFSVSTAGETVTLANPGGVVIDAIDTGELRFDISLGRESDGAANWALFATPTPGVANIGPSYAGYTEPPTVSQTGGFFLTPLSLELLAPSPDATVFYSLDGSRPSDSTGVYVAPLSVSATTVLRARAQAPGLLPSATLTHSYFFGETLTLPTLSLAIHPDYLWDTEIGIYVLGDDYDPVYPYYGANFWEHWERPAHIEFYEADGQLAFAQDLGVKIHGNWTRALPQKSLRLYARGGYGESKIEYRVFPDKDIDTFKRLILRSSGNDWCATQFRDGYGQDRSSDWDLDRQAYRPAALFINGQYWGIHNVRERLDKYYLEENHGVDPDAVDFLEKRGNPGDVAEGDNLHWQALLDYLDTHDMADPDAYAYVQTQMETGNFADYNIFEIYYVNTDWPGNNRRYWRPRDAGGRWRWFPYDLDLGLGFNEPYTHNTLAFALDPIGGPYNPPWSTFMLRALMESPSFRQDFINRYADLLNTQFRPEVMILAAEATRDRIAAEIPRHMQRWGHTVAEWQTQVDVLMDFLANRPAHARLHIQQQFGLTGTYTLGLDVSPDGAGAIQLAAMSIDSTFTGSYFLGNPVALKALPAGGWEFAGWSDAQLPQDESVTIAPDDDFAVTALFQPSGPGEPQAIINEINYNADDAFDPGDWVELHNPGESPKDISGWVFKDGDDGHAFALPPGTLLPADGYLVLCEDLGDFQALFPEVSNVLGPLDFGFSGGGEELRLFDGDATLMDVVEYDDSPPWPTEPDGDGPTLELTDPLADNAQPENWAASSGHGTPGAPNSALGTSAPLAPPAGTALFAPHPNPFNPSTRLEFVLEREQAATLSVHDVTGRRLAVLASGRLAAGSHHVDWNGRDSAGHPLASGLYLLRLRSEDGVRSQKLLLLR